MATSKIPSGRGGRRDLLYVFTEHGAVASSAEAISDIA
jgi:hypothetical protein